MMHTEHIQTARDFLEKSDHYFAEGDELQGSEKIWQAAAHSVMAVAQQRGWPFGDRRSLSTAVKRLSEEQDDPLIELAFSLAEKFHANSHHKFMQDYEFDGDRPAIHHFVQRMEGLAGMN